jgi:glucokinase
MHEPRLIADIGGTNTRFAVGQAGRFDHMLELRNAEHATFQDAARHFLDQLPNGMRVSKAALAVAGGTSGDVVSLTNYHWSFSVARVRDELGLAELRVINDFEAIAMAVPYLGTDERVVVGPDDLPVRRGPIALVGPGTGLGVAGLIPTRDGWSVVPTEGGHSTMAAATCEEGRVLDLLRKRWDHVSAERVLSGPGLENLYVALRLLDGASSKPLSAAEITAAMVGGEDPYSGRAFELFCRMLGTVAGNVALTFGATGGVYVAGGILLRFKDAFAASGFRARFEQKGRLSAYLRSVPTYLIVHPQPALIGLATLEMLHVAKSYVRTL